MQLLDWLNRNRICKCETCITELNVYAYGSGESLILYCVACNEYFFRADPSSPVNKHDVPEGLLKLWGMDPYNIYYKGIPISQAYEPKWIRLLRKFLRKCKTVVK
ncbi:hypothetical protein MKY64_10835 [Paenibacillus sp. FSL R7-0210]|uniref:hypothetical protein n=1 Tax=Paenibacillus sp. FSL R7-0210 TaxID=2921676 RepID=UPI0030FA8D68